MSRSLSRTLLLAASLLLPLTAVHADETLSYDANGNFETRTLPWGTTQYGYDDLDRVTSEAGPARTQSFTYDANDNRLSDGAGTKTYTPNTDRLLTENGQSIVLDAAGHITQLRGLTLAWNQAGQLKTVSRNGTLLATYYYDYQGRRSRKVVEGSGSLTYRTTIYIHDLYDHLIGEFNGAGNPRRTYVWRDDIPVAIIDPGDRVLYLETDHLNTPIAARNQAGTVIWKWESDAFGATLPNQDPDGDGMPTTINLRFPGQYYDKESGLHYNHHRYYDPKLGRYVSSDPIGVAGGRNTYGYANQNPLSNIDPDGLQMRIPQSTIPGFPNPRGSGGSGGSSSDDFGSGGVLEKSIPGGGSGAGSGSGAGNGSGDCPDDDFCGKRKRYCITFCQYELDMPGRRDNFGPHRRCIRMCMNAAGCNDY